MNDPKRKLIFLWTYLEWGGAQVYFMATMKRAKADWDVLAVLPARSSPEILKFLEDIEIKYELIDIEQDSAPAPTVSRKLVRQFRRVINELSLLRYLSKFDMPNSVLHIEISPWQSWQFLTVLALRGANVFVTMHNAIVGSKTRQLVWKARMKFVSRLPGFHIFTSNEHTKLSLKELVEPEFWSKVPVTYTCVDPVEIESVLSTGRDPLEVRKAHGFGPEDRIVLCVGQFIDRKGRWTFLEAAKLLQATDPDIRFIWMTPSWPGTADLRRVEEFGLKNFQLVLSRDVANGRSEVLEFIRIATVFTLPSFVEGLPIALLEAMALGVPSVSTNVYAIPEAVKDSETGLLIPAGNAEQLAEAIRTLLVDGKLRERLSRSGQAYVMKHFDEREAAAIALGEYAASFK